MEETNKTRDAEDTKQKILAVAEELFAQKGFAGTTIRKISEKSGCSGPLILFHFHSKKGLYQGVKENIMNRYEKNYLPQFVSFSEDPGIVTKMASSLFAFYRDNPNMIRLSNWSLLEGDQEPWSGEGDVHHLYYSAIARAQEKGFLRNDISPASLMAILCGAIHIWWEYHDHMREITENEGVPPVEDKKFLDQFIAFASQGLAPISKETEKS